MKHITQSILRTFGFMLILLCASYSQQNTQLITEAYESWLNGEFSKAVRLYESACYDEDMRGCHALGTLYFQGSGVAQNYSMSASYYAKACEGDFEPSCNSLGVLHHFGLGVRQDYDFALMLYNTSCQAGYARACNNVGTMFESGLSVKRDYKQAGLYYSDACLARDDRACFNLAELYVEGNGVKKDKIKAAQYYGLACDFGFQEGCNKYKELKSDKKIAKQLLKAQKEAQLNAPYLLQEHPKVRESKAIQKEIQPLSPPEINAIQNNGAHNEKNHI